MPDGRRAARRIRGDTLMTYDEELFRITDQAREEFKIPVSDVALTVVPQTLVKKTRTIWADMSTVLVCISIRFTNYL